MFCSHVCTFKKKSSQYSFTNVSWDNSGTLVTYNSEILGYTTIAVGKGGLLVSHISSAAAHVLAVIGLHSFCVVGGTIPTRKPTALEVVFHARWTLLMPSGLNSVGRGGGGWGEVPTFLLFQRSQDADRVHRSLVSVLRMLIHYSESLEVCMSRIRTP